MAAEENKKVHILGVWMLIVRETLFLALHILSFLINLQLGKSRKPIKYSQSSALSCSSAQIPNIYMYVCVTECMHV